MLALSGIICFACWFIFCNRHFNDGDMGVAILTVKEAAWLTDGTYTYTQVVKMMGDVMGLLKGQYRVSTSSSKYHMFLYMMIMCCYVM